MKYFFGFLSLACVLGCSNDLNVPYTLNTAIRQYYADSTEASLNNFSAVIAATDTSFTAFHYRGLIYKEKEDYEKALADFNEAARLKPTAPFVFANRASVYYMKENYVMALIDYKKALELHPGFAEMYNPIAHMLFATGKKEEVCKYYQKAMEAGFSEFNEEIVKHCNGTLADTLSCEDQLAENPFLFSQFSVETVKEKLPSLTIESWPDDTDDPEDGQDSIISMSSGEEIGFTFIKGPETALLETAVVKTPDKIFKKGIYVGMGQEDFKSKFPRFQNDPKQYSWIEFYFGDATNYVRFHFRSGKLYMVAFYGYTG
jgi:tetratricopeptide (TPR) repeat protein